MSNENTKCILSVSARILLAFVFVFGLPFAAAAQSPGHLYVVLTATNAVAVVDTSTNTVVNTIQIAPAGATGIGTRPFDIAITPDGNYAYVVNESCDSAEPPSWLGPSVFTYLQGTVSVIDITPNSPTYNTVIKTIGVGLCPTSIAITPDGTAAYVSNAQEGTLSLINTQTHGVTPIAMPNSAFPMGLAANPNGGHVYVADQNGALDILDTVTNGFVSAVSLVFGGRHGCTADRVAVTPDGSQVYVTSSTLHNDCGSFAVVDAATALIGPASAEIYSAPGGTFCTPGGIMAAPDGKHVYSLDWECQQFIPINTPISTPNPTTRPFSVFNLLDNPNDVATTPDGSTLYMTITHVGFAGSRPPNGLLAVDTATLTIPGTLTMTLNDEPAGLAFAPINTAASNPASTPITAHPVDLATGTTPVTVTFSSGIASAGYTNLTISSSGPAPPAGFQLGSPAVYYDIATSAQYPPNVAGSIIVCINYTGISFSGTPVFSHYENGAWVIYRASFNGTNTLCAAVSSLSPFALFTPTQNQAPLTVAANIASRRYGSLDPSFTVSYSGFVNGDTAASLSGALVCTSSDTAASPVGTYAINCSGLSSPNYVITYVPGTLTITPAPLTITADSFARPYGANNPVFTGTVTGVLNSDPVGASFVSSPIATAASPVGTYFIVPMALGPANALSNYSISLVNGTLTVVPETTSLTVTFAPLTIMVGQSTTATITLTAPGMVIPIDPSVLAKFLLTSPLASDILTNGGMCTPVPAATPGLASCTIGITSVEPNGRNLNAVFSGTLDLGPSADNKELMVTASLLSQQVCINSDFRNVAVPGGSTLWFNSIFRVRDVTKQLINISFFNSTVQFQYTDPSGHLVTVNQAMPDAHIVIDPTATAATTSFDAVNNVWLTTIPFDLDDNAFLTGLPWLVPSAGLPGDVEPVSWCGTFASDVADIDIGWRWAAAAYSSFGNGNSTLGVKPMNTDHDNLGTNRDRAGTPENFKQFLVPGARGKGGTNYTGTYSASKEIE